MTNTEFPKTMKDYARWADFFKTHLRDQVMPFYLNHALDRQFGGYTTCLDNDGTQLSGDKYLWSQGRGTWTFAALYEQLDRNEKYFEAAKLGVEFLKKHGRDENGDWVYHTDREGKVIEGPLSIYVDMFAAYGLTVWSRIAHDPSALHFVVDILNKAYDQFNTPGFNCIAPYKVKPGRRVHGPPMIFLNVAEEVCRTANLPEMEQKAEHCVKTILDLHYRPNYNLILEEVTWDGQEIDAPEGRLVVPGHSVECGWFLLQWAARKNRPDIVAKVAGMIHRSLTLGWDRQYGGLFLAIDLEGRPHSTFANSDCKPWWISSEALYALALLYELTGLDWIEEWFLKIFHWAMDHHRSPWGDWYQRLDRQGNPITKVIGLPVKDPFHLPRALLLTSQCFQRLAEGKTWKGQLHD